MAGQQHKPKTDTNSVMSSEASVQGRDRQPATSIETNDANAPEGADIATPAQVQRVSREATDMQKAPKNATGPDRLAPQSADAGLQFQGTEKSKERAIKDAKANKPNH